MNTDHIRPISQSSLANESELVAVRTRTKQVADLCALGRPAQTRLLTAVSEIARNAIAHGDGARVCFDIVDKIDRHFLRVTIESNGISSAFTKPKEDFTEIQFSLESVQRLVDELTVEKTTKGRSVSLSKQLPGLIEENKITSWKEMLSIEPPNAVIEDLQQQNRDLVMALNEIQLVKIELEERTRQLQQASMLKAQFVANVSHEIRTPMNAILGITNLLAKRITEPEELKLLGHLHEASSSLLTIINSILDLSKIDEGKLEILNELFSLPDLVSGTVAIFVPDAEESGIHIEVNYGDGFPESVIGDKNRLRQILINLIGNALKFTDKGNVVVNAGVNWTNEDRVGIRISVVDEGIGIAEKDLESLFEPFSQLPAAGQRRTGGTGLGLSICKRLVQLLDGEIGVNSVLGRGSTFWFELSCQVPGNSVTVPLVKSTALNFEDHKVLLVEDHPVNQLVAAGVLEELGITFDIASNGLEALQAYKSNRYDLILMDCQMPEMNGFEATAAIRALEKESDIRVPIVAVTANAMAGDRERCLNLGMDDYVSKPYNLEELALCLAKWFVGAKTQLERHPEGVTQDSEDTDVLFTLAKLSERFTPPQVRELLGKFMVDTSDRIQVMQSTLLAGDFIATGGNAHALRGACSMLSMPGMGKLCQDLEIACYECDQKSGNDVLLRFIAQFDSLREELQAIQF